MLDTHYHFDFLTSSAQREFVQANAAAGINVVAQTLTPSSYVEQTQQPVDGPIYALGYHPWYIESAEAAARELAIFDQALPQTRFIGEIGMDFIPRNLETAPEELQRHVFGHILDSVCEAAEADTEKAEKAVKDAPEGDAAPYVLSIHAVRSATTVLDMLEERDVFSANIVPVIHWFSGTSDELTRLIRTGGYVSINPMMLGGKRGRAYAKQVPADRILLETDFPSSKDARDKSGAQHSAELLEGLTTVRGTLAELRGDDIAAEISRTEQRLFLDRRAM